MSQPITTTTLQSITDRRITRGCSVKVTAAVKQHQKSFVLCGRDRVDSAQATAWKCDLCSPPTPDHSIWKHQTVAMYLCAKMLLDLWFRDVSIPLTHSLCFPVFRMALRTSRHSVPHRKKALLPSTLGTLNLRFQSKVLFTFTASEFGLINNSNS